MLLKTSVNIWIQLNIIADPESGIRPYKKIKPESLLSLKMK